MKQSFKKIVSILLVAMLLVSVIPAMFVTTASAVDGGSTGNATRNDGTGVYDEDKPEFEGVSEFRFVSTGEGRKNFSLKYSATDKAFKPTVGQWYTVSFDVLYDSSTNVTSINWASGIYMGNEPTGGDGREDYGDGEIVRGYDDSHIDDGQWHTVSISFVGKEIKGDNGNVLQTAYFTLYTSGKGNDDPSDDERIEIHFKNVKITEGAIYDETIGGIKTLKISNTVKEDGKTKRLNATSAFTFNGVDEEGNLSVTATSQKTFNVGSNVGSTTTVADWVNCLLPDESLELEKGIEYTASFRYQVTIAGTDMRIGIASSAKNGDTPALTTASSPSYVYGIHEPTAASDDWVDFTCTFTAADDSYIKIALNGTNATYLISDITVSSEEKVVTHAESPAYRLPVNDNGELKDLAVYPGDSLADAYICDGASLNATNAAMGEKLMGWYSDPHFTTEVSTAPAKAEAPAVLYAKYPSVVIDFNYRTAYTEGYGMNDYGGMAMWVDNSTGIAQVQFSANNGIMIPSYDAAISDTTIDAFYQFKDGVKYKLTYVYESSNVASGLTHTVANFAGNKGGSRKTDSDAAHGQAQFVVTNEETTVSHILTYKAVSGFDGRGIAIRFGKTNTVRFDKIIITELTEDNYVNGGLKSEYTLDYNDGATAPESFALAYGEYKQLPVPTRENYIFAGWYKGYAAERHALSSNDIPRSFAVGTTDPTVTLTAQWVSTSTIKVDFDEATYWDSSANNGVGFGTGHASQIDAAGKFTVENIADLDAESDGNYAHFLNTGDGNVFKISLFNDDGSRVLAMNGVTYRISIRYKVTTATSGHGIAVCRNAAGSFGPCGFDGYDSFTNIGSGAVTNGFVVATKDVTAENMYRADSGTTESLVNAYRDQIGIRINTGEVYIDYVEITPVSYTPANQGFDATKGDVSIDYVNKTVTVTPNDGYNVSAAGLSVLMNYRNYTVDNNTVTVTKNDVEKLSCAKYVNNDPSQGLISGTEDGLIYKYTGDYTPSTLNALKVTVDFVAEGDTNAAFIAGSTRDASGSGDTYVSAGIRFRARVDDANIEGADKVEFIIVPEKSLNGKTIKDYMEAGGGQEVTGVAYRAADNKNVVYEKIGGYTDYQAVVTGLTKDGSTTDLTKLKLCAALRITKGDSVEYVQMSGAYAYTDLVK